MRRSDTRKLFVPFSIVAQQGQTQWLKQQQFITDSDSVNWPHPVCRGLGLTLQDTLRLLSLELWEGLRACATLERLRTLSPSSFLGGWRPGPKRVKVKAARPGKDECQVRSPPSWEGRGSRVEVGRNGWRPSLKTVYHTPVQVRDPSRAPALSPVGPSEGEGWEGG